MRGSVESYRGSGYVIVRGFMGVPESRAILDAAVELARAAHRGESTAPAFVMPESNLADRPVVHAEDAVSKIFRLHRLEPFHSFVTNPDLTAVVAGMLETADFDCFGSQFIFKNPGAWGQPCHQDSHYFPFDPEGPVVGAWLAVTESSTENGCLYVVPGSHTEPAHEHVPDRRPDANLGYMEIVDYDLASAEPVEMQPGDLLLFDSFLMHFSRDNLSARRRGAMVCHYAPVGIVDHAEEHFGFTIHDWMPISRRRGRASS